MWQLSWDILANAGFLCTKSAVLRDKINRHLVGGHTFSEKNLHYLSTQYRLLVRNAHIECRSPGSSHPVKTNKNVITTYVCIQNPT